MAYETAVKSTVLLKNDGILPLKKENYKSIAVMGPNADSVAALLGNYSGTPARTITLLEGIRCYCENAGIRVNYAHGSQLIKEPRPGRPQENSRVVEAQFVAENSDLVILCVGLDASLEGEQGDTGNEFSSGDKPDLLLPRIQRELVSTVLATGKPVILVNATGSPVDLSAYEAQAKAILQVWYPGGEGGRALADILFGEISPAGKLPITFYYNDNILPDITDYSMKERTYRYMSGTPWRCFGYGLTYSNIDITSLQLPASASYAAVCGEGIVCEVTCKNTGTFDVSDVLQVYVHVNGTQNEVPNKKLAAFQRITLNAGESDTFRLTVPASVFGVINENGERVFDGTGATISVGFSSDTVLQHTI